MVREDKLCFVQFMHPGREHRPDDGRLKRWNRDDHRRKFLIAPGECLQDGEVLEAELVFWGEWEAESEVVAEIDRPLPRGPRYIYRPFYVPPRSYARLQNTDPFVFDTFLYGICRQHSAGRPTQLRHLERGSVILFGSCVANEFVLDTVFVVADWIDHHRGSYASVLDGQVPSAYADVALKPLYLSGRNDGGACAPGDNRSYRLYFGATRSSPVEGMFSFFPCVPFEKGTPGFARPTLCIPELITDDLHMGYRLNPRREQAEVRRLWDSVVEQVEAQGLSLGVRARTPDRRSRAQGS